MVHILTMFKAFHRIVNQISSPCVKRNFVKSPLCVKTIVTFSLQTLIFFYFTEAAVPSEQEFAYYIYKFSLNNILMLS